MIKKYCEHYEGWRNIVSEYYQIDMKLAKKKITTIFYGVNPQSDLPMLWNLRQNVDSAISYLLNLQENAGLNKLFSERKNPKYSKFAYLMAEKENEVLHNIIAEIERVASLKPLCLIYDGAIIEA